jgi:hypothetical protein
MPLQVEIGHILCEPAGSYLQVVSGIAGGV